MATFEWGLSKWDIDKDAESLNKDLFGGKKMKKRVLAPDCKDDNKNSFVAHDSDDEQLSKKAKKRLKERMRKKKKKAGETDDASRVQDKSAKSESQSKGASPDGNLNEVRSGKKEKKKKITKAPETPSDDKGSENANRSKKKSMKSNKKEATPRIEMKEKPKKRRKEELETPNNDPIIVKKRKISEKTEESLGEQQEKKRKRPNRKKKNNSKKNKYKHLALNSKNKMNSGNEALNGDVKKSLAESENKINASLFTSKTGQTNVSNSSSHVENDSQQKSGSSPLNKKGDKRKKNTKKLNDIDSPSKEVSENIKQSKGLTPISDKERSKELANGSRKKSETGSNKTQSRINKQKLLNMLKNSTSDTVDQSVLSLADASSLNESEKSKKKSKKRKRSQSENGSNEKILTDISSNSLPGLDSSVVASCDASADKTTPSKGLSNTAKDLKDKATEKLKAARFRFINEQLYNCKGHEALQLFRKDLEAFRVYHQGFQSQTSRWPVNPLDAIIKHINKRPKQLVVADFGCGDARLSESVAQKVHSFDLVALNDRVTACDMSKTPLADDSIDIAVFCLSLMGTNLNDFLLEANRVLKTGGLLKIAEVVSRFHNPEQFIKQVTSLGFLLLNKRELSEMFYLMDFKKTKRMKKSPSNVEIKLKPCVYKKR